MTVKVVRRGEKVSVDWMFGDTIRDILLVARNRMGMSLPGDLSSVRVYTGRKQQKELNDLVGDGETLYVLSEE